MDMRRLLVADEPIYTQAEELQRVLLTWVALYGDSWQSIVNMYKLTNASNSVYGFSLMEPGFMELDKNKVRITEKGKQWILDQTK